MIFFVFFRAISNREESIKTVNHIDLSVSNDDDTQKYNIVVLGEFFS